MLRDGMRDSDIPLVDHLDGDKLNNSADNLVLGCPKLNSRNKKMARNNRSGKTGVFVIISKGKKYARAQWYDLDGAQD